MRRTPKKEIWLGAYINLNVLKSSQGSQDGPLTRTPSKGRLHITTRLGVRDGAGPPPSNIHHIRHPSFCPRPCAHRHRARLTLLTLFFAVKVGYPPRSLTAVIPELPLSSLGLAPGDQLIVNQKSGSAAPPTGAITSTAQSLPTSQRTFVNPSAASATLPEPSPNAVQAAPALSTTTRNDGPDHVEVDGGYLIHRVRVIDCRWHLATCTI